jgi:LAGLIDADG DNA endonuclease family protein
MMSFAELKMERSRIAKERLTLTDQHIRFTDKETILYASEKNKIYVPTTTGQLAHDDNSFVRLIVGPYGSGKSTWCVNEIVRRTCAMPIWHAGRRRARWAIVRNTSGELQSTTLQTWLAWFGDLGDIHKRQKPLLTYEHTFNDGRGIVELELIFLALDREEDLRKIKSLEVTGAYINELSEVPQGALAHFKGRVNKRYPSRAFCSSDYWSGIIADSNPPDIDHWLYKDFELKSLQSYKIFHQPPGLLKDEDGKWFQNPSCDNAANLAHDYYTKLAEGQTEDFVKVYCLGEYGSVGFGKKVYPEYNDDIHSVIRITAIQGTPIHLGWDFGLCYSRDTEVLTNNGWKFFCDVDEKTDLAATRNPLTKEMEFTPINFKVEYDYEGELLQWDSKEVNFCVTPEHRVPFSYRDTPDKIHFESAQWLADHRSGHHYVDLCSEWKPTFDESISYFGMSAHQFAQFMGLYLSEGSCDLNRITIYQNNQNPVMQEILDNTGRKWKYDGASWRCVDPLLAQYLKQFGKAGHKYVPNQIKQMPSNIIKAFIYSYTMGDGHIRTRPNGAIEHTLFTISKRMANDFQELAQKAGWNSSLRIVKPQISIMIEEGVEREISNNGGYCITFKKRAKRAELLNRNFSKVPYKGKIYCLNVPYHVLYIRRNGKPSWNGNTPACVVVQISPRGQLRVLKEYTAEDMGIRTFAKNIVIPSLERDFPYCKVGISRADPSGIAGDDIMEELSCIGELNSLGVNTAQARTNDLEPRIGSVRYFLNTMIDGQPAFQLSREGCPMLRRGFTKDYCYKRISVGGEERYKEVPHKNMSSHPQDGLQYIAMEFAADQIMAAKSPHKPVDMWNPVLRIF